MRTTDKNLRDIETIFDIKAMNKAMKFSLPAAIVMFAIAAIAAFYVFAL